MERHRKAYGEIDANNHADLKHVKATAATKEVTKSAIVTAKLPSDPKSPKTGDNSNIVLWIALLFISGGAVIGTTVIIVKNKKRSAE